MSAYFSPKPGHGHSTERECDLYCVFETQGRVRVNVVRACTMGYPRYPQSPLGLPFASYPVSLRSQDLLALSGSCLRDRRA